MGAMRESPPPQLAALLDRLGLAGTKQLDRAGRHVRRLVGDLPRFESVWIDALAQTGAISPFQATELAAGRGDALRVGPYLLCQPLGDCPWIATYRARHAASGEMVRLALAEASNDDLLPPLRRLAALAPRLDADRLAAIGDVGADRGRLWAASPWRQGRTAAQWIVHHGRMPPEAVTEIARAMVAALASLEENGLCHGDVAAQSVLLGEGGRVWLLQPGLRPIFRPSEGYAQADLQPEAFDCLAPERITAGGPPDRAGDVYACGCLWWHLLCGRPPLAGGDGLSKLRGANGGDRRRAAIGAGDARRVGRGHRRMRPARSPSPAGIHGRAGRAAWPRVAPRAEACRPATRQTGTSHRCLGRPAAERSTNLAASGACRDCLDCRRGNRLAALAATRSRTLAICPEASVRNPPLPPGDGRGEGNFPRDRPPDGGISTGFPSP